MTTLLCDKPSAPTQPMLRMVSTLCGTVGDHTPATYGTVDGIGRTAKLYGPNGIIVGVDGYVYVAEFGYEACSCPAEQIPEVPGGMVVRKIDPDTGAVTTLAGQAGVEGYADGTGKAARFGRLVALCNDTHGNLLLADHTNNKLRRITLDGKVTTICGEHRFNGINGVDCDRQGTLYVADVIGGELWKITDERRVVWLGKHKHIANVIVAPDQRTLYLTTFCSGEVKRCDTDGRNVVTLVRDAYLPNGFALDAKRGYLYIAHAGGYRHPDNGDFVSSVSLTPPHQLTVIAGHPGRSGFIDGLSHHARFYGLAGCTLNADASKLYILDYWNELIRVLTLTD